MTYHQPDAPDLSQIKSDAIRAVAEMAIASGNEVTALAVWSRALVAHMRDCLTPALKTKIEARWPVLEYYSDDGSPHNEPDEGYIEDGFAVSFPRPR